MLRNAEGLQTYRASGRRCKILFSEEQTGTKDMSALLVEFNPGEGTPVHTHDGIEVMYVISGEGISVEDGKETKIYPNTAVLAEKGVPHAIINGAGGPMRMLCVYIPPLPDSYIKANYEETDDDFLK
jgi:mannose-6-phosphate isomerase-like protein (cupin superfamily)